MSSDHDAFVSNRILMFVIVHAHMCSVRSTNYFTFVYNANPNVSIRDDLLVKYFSNTEREH